jgi:hypothetical protein
MNSPPRKIAERGLFRPVWIEFNRLLDYVREISPMGGRNVQQIRTLNGTLTIAEAVRQSPAENPAPIKQYRVKTVASDHLVCREFDGTTEGPDSIAIARPFNLRRAIWRDAPISYPLESYPGGGGTAVVSYSYISAVYRTATIGTLIEHQVVIPRYVPNFSIIFATQPDNGTGVGLAPDWLDLNVDGRAWAAVL